MTGEAKAESAPFSAWIGVTEAVEDDIVLAPVLGVAAALDDTESGRWQFPSNPVCANDNSG